MSRKEEILDALIGILTNKGMNSNFTMKELAEKVDIGKSTIYEYFQTKEELVHQAILRIIENGVNEVFKDKIEAQSSFETAFKKEIRSLYNMALNSAHVINIITPGVQEKAQGKLKEDIMFNIKSARDQYELRFNKIFRKAFAEGIISLKDIEMKTYVISSLVVGSIFRIANLKSDKMPLNTDKYVNIIYDTVLKISDWDK